MCEVKGGGVQQNLMCEPQVNNGLILGQSDMFCKKAPDISVKLGEGAGV